jgi:phosphate transport system permease protein
MLTISSVIGIFVFLLIQVVPLASGARVDVQRVLELGLDSPQVVLVDEYLQHVVLMDGKGRYSVRTTDGSELLLSGRMPLEAGEEVTEVSSVPEQYTLTAATSRGRVLLQPFSFEANYGAPTGEEGLRSVRVEASVLDPIVVQIDPRGRRILTHTAHVDEVGGWSIVAQLEDKTLRYLNRGVSVNPMTEEETVTERVLETVVESRIDHVLLSGGRPRIFAALEDGPLVWWELRRERFGAMRRGVQPDGAELVGAARVTAMSMLLGGESVIVGRADGGVSVWFPVRVTEDRNDFELTEVHRFDAMTSAVLSISASRRNRSFVCLAQDGGISLCYATTADVDWSGRSGLVAVQSVALSPKSDALVVAGADSAELYSLDNPHPELSMGTLFGKVWYEGAREPSYEWQSTGGSQAYERKLSFVPLIWGTLKGTLFSLLLSLPIAVFLRSTSRNS